MRRFADSAEDRGDTNYWMPVSNIIVAGLLLLLVVFAVGIVVQGNMAPEGEISRQVGQNAEIEETVNKGLADSAAAVRKVAGIRTDIINELDKKLTGLKLPVEINKVTGNIRFTEAVLFDVNKDTLNPVGQNYLKTFVPAYLSVLLDNKYEEYLEQIIVEGHADNGGTYSSNLILSQSRANKVMDFILSQKLSELSNGNSADKYFTISARSFNVPVLVNGVPDRNQSRRVEFVFRLKDDELLNKLQEIYQGE